MNPDEYCANRIAEPGTDIYYSLLFLPGPERRAAAALYAFTHEVEEIGCETHDVGVALTKFAWWREEIQRLFEGRARHPVTQALTSAFDVSRLDRDLFLVQLDEAARSFGRARQPDFESLQTHCHRSGSAPSSLVAGVLGMTDSATGESLTALGAALRLGEILCQLGQDARRDRLHLPLDDMRRFGVSETDVLACRQTPAFTSLMAFQTERASARIGSALQSLPTGARRAQLPLIILANLRRAQLAEIRRDGFRVLERRLTLTPLRKLWIAWRTRLRPHSPA